MPITKPLLLMLLSAVLMTACDSSINTSDETEVKENLVEKTGNPCLESWAIDRMKEHIKERAEELITTKYGEGVIDSSLIYESEISFDYISQPTTLENGDLSCSTKVTVSYVGNENSSNELAINYAKLVNANIGYDSNPFANAFSGYSIKEELSSMGISEFNINDFSDIAGNTFSTQMEYELRKTYSENGEEQQSYQAGIGRPAAMLATIALLDKFIQNNQKSSNASSVGSAEEQETETDSYYYDNDEYAEDVEDNSIVVEPQQQQAPDRREPENGNQKVSNNDTAQTVVNTEKVKAKPDVSEVDTEEQQYDTAYVYDYAGESVE